MRKKIYGIFLSLWMIMAVAVAQEVPAGLTEAFQKGNAQMLSTYLAESVEMISSEGTQILNRTKAINTLSSFFANNPPTGFITNHKGKRGESSFLVGTLSTNGNSFRLNIFFKKDKNNYLIHQIRIDKTHE